MRGLGELACVALVLLSIVCSTISSPRVTVSQGQLAGSWMTTRGGRRIAAFRGIPYAAPPVGELRFQSPKPPKSWARTKLAVEDGHKCVQHNHYLGISGEEDCLYLNVFTPNVIGSLPVLFFIHGGAFKSGSGGSFFYGPKFLLDEDIVLVTVNYRLNIFGFLSLEDEVLPGNLGLKDQRMALKWVQDNIKQFGGDPAAVTIFGESAGAASVHFHLLFNSEEGLFRAGILHSWTALSPGGFQRPGDQRPIVHHILNRTNCQFGNSSAIVECLRKIRPYRLMRHAISFLPPFESLLRNVELSPVIEPECVPDAFITEDPWNRTSSLPMIIGTNQYEGLFTIADILKDRSDELFEDYDNNYEKILPYNLMFDKSAEDPLSIARLIRKFYLNNGKINREHVLQLVDLLSDGIFNFGATEAITLNQNKTYFYSFNYLGSKSFLNLLGYENTYGPTHGDELLYFFPLSLERLNRNTSSIEDDKLLSKQLIQLWVNFATHLEPSVKGVGVEVNWQPVSDLDLGLNHLSIDGPGNLTMVPQFHKSRMAFWRNLPFRNKPFPDSISCVE